ncbi:MAG: hypothetical protein NTX05_08730 [Fusobacteria bacterium]|nr:hypothetical protein [Fusobacteriota bacterium]
MKKILLLTIITAGTILSATAFAGQGFDVQVVNNQSYPIQYEETDDSNWNADDIPENNTWITIAAHSTSYKYTESYGLGWFGDDYITVAVESTTGTKIGYFSITDSPKVNSDGWPADQVVVTRFGPNSDDDWYSVAVELPNEPYISVGINDTQKQDNVNFFVG